MAVEDVENVVAVQKGVAARVVNAEEGVLPSVAQEGEDPADK